MKFLFTIKNPKRNFNLKFFFLPSKRKKFSNPQEGENLNLRSDELQAL